LSRSYGKAGFERQENIASVLFGERRTQREIAEVAGVTEVTIRNRYQELAEKLDLEVIL
jgi:transcription initiation factor TFIIB